MKNNRRKLKLFLSMIWIIFLVGCTISYEGCSDGYDEDPLKKYQKQMLEDMQKDEKDGRIATEDDMVLAQGEILKVRLHYGKDTLETEAWYKVKITNERNGWYDYVEVTAYHGFGNSEKNYDDYTFTSTNFNRQITDKHYDPQMVQGDYRLTITGSNGHYVEKWINWDNDLNGDSGGWTTNSPTMAYNVP
ncbi:MAG: hypothetical protein AAGU14_10065 [Eubacteriaceae bacterium]